MPKAANTDTVYTSRNPGYRNQSREKPVAITPEGKKIFAYDKNGTAICNSQRTKNRGRCESVATMMNGRCRLHGGKAPTGMMHYKATNLRSADSMPSHLKGDMIAALADQNRLSLDHEIALVDTKLEQQKKALETGLGVNAFKRLQELADRLEYALAEDPEKSEKVCEDLINTIRHGIVQREVWKEIDVTVEVRRKLVETAHKREMSLKSMLKGDQAFALMTGVASACKEEIAKTFTNIEQRYKLVDKDSGKEVIKIDIAFKNDFLSSVGIALGRLVSKPDANRDIPVDEDK